MCTLYTEIFFTEDDLNLETTIELEECISFMRALGLCPPNGMDICIVIIVATITFRLLPV